MTATFLPQELGVAVISSVAVQAVAVLSMLYTSLDSETPPQAEVKKSVPMAVKPILDMTPLLKLGSQAKAKLPDMWVKQKPIKRVEQTSAPSPDAKKTPEAIPSSKLAPLDAAAPPPDAQTAKEVDDDILRMDATPETVDPKLAEKGTEDGHKDGTETDPLKGRAVSIYRGKIIAWFNRRFQVPTGTVPCDQLKGLSAAVTANVGGDRTVTGYSLTKPSGNAAFDGRVRAAMDSAVGQQLPPPPPNYPDILDSAVYAAFSGGGQKCE